MISILIANYNNQNYIIEAIQSVINQSYKNWELIIYDDGSEDQNWIEKVRSNFHQFNIIFHVSEQNNGCGFAKKKLIDLANGEYFIFLDPDDAFHEQCLFELCQVLKNNDQLSIAYGTHFICNESLISKNVSDYPSQVRKGESMFNINSGNISAPALVCTKKYKLTSGLNEKLIKAVDNDLYAKMEEVGYVNFVNKPLYFYRQHSANISTGKNEIDALKYRLIVINDLYLRRKNKPTKYTRNITKQEKNELEFLYFEFCFYRESISKMRFWFSFLTLISKTSFHPKSILRLFKIFKIKISTIF